MNKAIKTISILFKKKLMNNIIQKNGFFVFVIFFFPYIIFSQSDINDKNLDRELDSLLRISSKLDYRIYKQSEEKDTTGLLTTFQTKVSIYNQLRNKYTDKLYFDSTEYYNFSSLTLLKNREEYLNKAKIYLNLAGLHHNESPRKALIYFEKAYDNLTKAKSPNPKVILFTLGKLYLISYQLGKLDKALNYNLQLEKILTELKDEKSLILTYNHIGKVYYELGRYENSLNYFSKELKLREKLNQNPLNYQFLESIAKVYVSMENYTKAEEYYKLAIEKYKKDSKPTNSKDNQLSRFYNALGKLYYLKSNFPLARKQYDLATITLDKSDKSEYKKGKSIILNNLSLLEKALGNYEKALEYVKESERVLGNESSPEDDFYLQTTIAEIYTKLDDYNNAEKYLKKALNNSIKDESRKNQKNAYNLLYKLYEENDRPNLALKSYKNYKLMSDSLYNEEMTDKLTEFQTIYEFERQNQENEALERAKRLEQEKREQEQRIRLFMMIIFVLTTLIVFALAYLFFNRMKVNRILVETNKRIEKQKDNLEELNEELRLNESQLIEANSTKDRFLSIIAHDLRNPLHTINFSSEVVLNYYNQIDEEKKKEHIKGIHKTAQETYILLENLLQWARAQNRTIEFNPQNTFIFPVVEHVIQLTKTNAENKNIEIINNVDKEINAFFDINMIETVLRNLVSNSLKFTPDGGKIKILGSDLNDKVVISVVDTGIGINEENRKKLFKIENQVSTLGTRKEKGSGLGLVLCSEFVKANNGSIWIDSSIGQGTTIFFSLPKSGVANSEPIFEKEKGKNES